MFDDEFSFSDTDFQQYILNNENIIKNSVEYLRENFNPYREYYGMASKKAQKLTNGEATKTAEGNVKPILIEYHIDKWAKNMKDYLASCMSYCGVTTIDEFRKEAEVIISMSGDKSFKK